MTKGRPRNTPITLPGRPRLAGDRYPSGRLKPSDKQPNDTPQAKIRRIIDMAKHGAADPDLASPLGWLRLHGKITDTEMAAGKEYAKLRGRADRALGLKRRTAASVSYETGFGGHGMLADIRSFEKANARFADLRSDLIASKYGRRCVDILDNICVLNQHCALWEVPFLIGGLREAAYFFGYALRPKENS